MVWLFTQVWLWSVAAFLLGSLITWLLFVLPLRRRLSKVRSEFTEYVEHQDARQDRQVWRTHDSAPSQKVERTSVQPRWEQDPEEDPLPDAPEPTRTDPQTRTDQAHTARLPHPDAERSAGPRAGTDARADVSVRGGSQVADLVVDHEAARPTERQRPQAPHAQQPDGSQANPATRSTGAWQEDESAYAGRSSGGWWPSRGVEDETPVPPSRPAAGSPWTIPTDHEAAHDAQRPSATDIGQALGRGENAATDPVADRPAESASTWFQKDAAAEAAESEIAGPAQPAAAGSANGADGGTEIFARPEAADGLDPATRSETPARSGPPGLSGAAELSAALGLSDLASSPKPASETAHETAEPAPEPEPEQPAESAAPERNEQREDHHGFAGNLRALVESRAHELAEPASGPAQSADVPVIAESEQTPLPRRTPGAGPRPGMRPAPGPPGAAWHADPQAQANRRRESLAGPEDPSQQGGNMIKGDFGSRRYHSPESPHYDRIVAEVWFRTEVDAEEAGFLAWNAQHRE